MLLAQYQFPEGWGGKVPLLITCSTEVQVALKDVSIFGHVKWRPGWRNRGAEHSLQNTGKVIWLDRGHEVPEGPGKGLGWGLEFNQKGGLNSLNGTLFFIENQENIWKINTNFLVVATGSTHPLCPQEYINSLNPNKILPSYLNFSMQELFEILWHCKRARFHQQHYQGTIIAFLLCPLIAVSVRFGLSNPCIWVVLFSHCTLMERIRYMLYKLALVFQSPFSWGLIYSLNHSF